ncbi:2890_t:CDS:2 [Paraglomus brasilianum]|uniref:2890_t:CDS:1 n=1 Tax=Paraglomus brasilianum TaxID=144538 RepID=A0A9N9B8N3_9GLOM|nr:2890_t:CDS:2 [Paraglomus brasilianum]
MRCEYILHACITIVKNITGEEISLNPHLEVAGEKSTGRVDYTVKALEELICITEGKPYQIAIGVAQVAYYAMLQPNGKKRKVAFGEEYEPSLRNNHYSHGVVFSPLHFRRNFMYM